MQVRTMVLCALLALSACDEDNGSADPKDAGREAGHDDSQEPSINSPGRDAGRSAEEAGGSGPGATSGEAGSGDRATPPSEAGATPDAGAPSEGGVTPDAGKTDAAGGGTLADAGTNHGTGGDAGMPGTADAGPPVPFISGERQSWNEYSFIVPQGLVGNDAGDQYEMISPDSNQNGLCGLLLLPLVSLQGEPSDVAYAILVKITPDGYDPDLKDEYGTGTPLIVYQRGQLVSGWNYVFLKTQLVVQATSQNSGEYRELMLVQVGDRYAPVLGVETTGNRCLMTFMDKLKWSLLMHTLQFPGTPPVWRGRELLTSEPMWHRTQGNRTVDRQYQANGRYFSSLIVDGEKRISTTEAEVIMAGWGAAGDFVLEGDQLTVQADDFPTATTNLIRFEESGSASGWLRYLYELSKTSSGGYYESYYQ